MKNKDEQKFTDLKVDADSEKELKKCKRKNKVNRIFKTITKLLRIFLLLLGIEIILNVSGIPNRILALLNYAIGFYLGYLLKK